jgi:hypothetical protein
MIQQKEMVANRSYLAAAGLALVAVVMRYISCAGNGVGQLEMAEVNCGLIVVATEVSGFAHQLRHLYVLGWGTDGR